MRTSRMVLWAPVVLLVLISLVAAGPGNAQTPQVALGNLNGPAFDAAYMQYLYQLNYDIATLANIGASRSASYDIRDFSKKIALERNDINSYLADTYPRLTNGQLLSADPRHPQPLIDQMNSYGGTPFEVVYARTMIPLMQLSMDVVNLAKERAVAPEVKAQVRDIYRTNSNESKAFDRWLQTGFLTFNDQSWYCESNYWDTWNDPRCFGMTLPRGPLFGFGFYHYH